MTRRTIWGGLFTLTVSLALLNCGGDAPTSPPQDTTTVAPVAAPAVAATPAAVAPTPSPDPGRQRGPVSVICGGGGACSFSNTADVARMVLAECTRVGEHNDWGSITISVPHGTDTASLTPYQICDRAKMGIAAVRCQPVDQKVQLDFTAGQGEHIGHWMPVLTFGANPDDGWKAIDPIVTVEFQYGEWGRCQKAEVVGSPIRDQTCAGIQERTVLKITTTQNREINVCTEKTRNAGDPIVVRERQPSETRACELENKLISETPGDFFWNEEVLQGRCDPEVFPIVQSTVVPLDCHQTGQQTINQIFTCGTSRRDRALCRNVQCPSEGNCFYNNNHWDGKWRCMALPGFVSWNDHNHLCELTFPGISDRDFQLNPGQSAPGCLTKRD